MVMSGKRLIAALLGPLVLIAIPFLLQPAPEERLSVENAEVLVIITAHSESIRYEFERAFRDFYRNTFGREIVIDWRSPGGTSDIVRYINDRFEAAFRDYYQEKHPGKEWNRAIAANFGNYRLNQKGAWENASPEVREAREEFLSSDVGIGIDLFFGGGVFDQSRLGEQGYAVDGGVQLRHPAIFSEEIIPHSFGGEVFYDLNGRYYGVCLSTFGICYNPERLAELEDSSPPLTWRDLGEPRFFRQLVVADPTKSGSITKCFEMILQQCLQEAIAADPVNGPENGWRDGMNLIKRIAANSISLTDSAGKIPRDVAAGNALAGMCIDFYAFAEAEWSSWQTGGEPRLVYVVPKGGGAITTDPVQMLRGAPNPQAAQAFMDFLLSKSGQKLWDYRKGEPDGPVKYVIRRPPIRKDLYQKEFQQHMADGDYNPYEGQGSFRYDPQLTSSYFNLIRVLVKCIALDPMEEMQLAWQEIIRAGGPEKVPEAMKEFEKLPFPYVDAGKANDALYTSVDRSAADVTALRRQWTTAAQEQYLRAAELARQGK